MRRLVIGIGNPLRGDDGVGPMLAKELPGRLPAPLRLGLKVRCLQQLLPELISEIAAVDSVLFIDAWQRPAAGALRGSGTGSGPRLLPLEAGPGPLETDPAVPQHPFSHALDAATLVQLATLLHGAHPDAHQLLVPASHFPHSAAFSAELRGQLPAARALLQRWCRHPLCDDGHA